MFIYTLFKSSPSVM